MLSLDNPWHFALFSSAIVKTLNLHLSSIARSQLDAALRHSPPCRTCDDLSHDFEEFFLNNADDVAEMLKESQNTGGVNQFHSQQAVCEMVQVSLVLFPSKVIPCEGNYVIPLPLATAMCRPKYFWCRAEAKR